ncbi:MAG: COQ9 family protein [Cypionkella sp.]|uniref:COQ9 family protein n=1 Tax=Cypionkella sp. TaxID=2811411 RepID=UPI002AB855B7|nr:COQ9 family protein [Cypionkella sp.]MDZ4308936.1 COQ9 family protein [Cypionkella sp.]
MDHENSMEAAKTRILQAALPHAAFDGWSQTTLNAALTDSDIAPALARALFPRGGIDLAVAYHQAGDQAMRDALASTDLTALRYTDRVAAAIKLRLAAADKELVRRGTTLFSLPQHAPEGAKLIWASADAIWQALGDTSTDLNWYTKRATLSAVYSATVLFWLGDHSDDNADTWAFLDRRLANVTQFEKTKAAIQANPLAKALLAGPAKLLEKIRAPKAAADLPGHHKP